MEQRQEDQKEQEIENGKNAGNWTQAIPSMFLCWIGLQSLSVYFLFTSSDFEDQLIWYTIALAVLMCANVLRVKLKSYIENYKVRAEKLAFFPQK
ncbi:unnamed protein product [Blepharisma stoltei]|uniref:Uncharacterized protein n=1 Tax=Blepharisma stoltei TaxID=1481888 RepID=A0AAU9JQ55_9CILI|nr:unnamed protein product [Blepharisma stoltei]